MELIIPIILNCLLVCLVYLADKRGVTRKWNYIVKQIVIGVLFGGVSAFASSVGVEWRGTTVNVRDAAPLSAGLIFGAPSGIIAGIIGGVYRWFSVYWGGGKYTRIACSLATMLAGFVAASYMRGIDFYNVPTTLLSQIDSSIGGKVAIDFDGIKNIVGAFYQPKKVVIDPNVLSTLPARQISNSGI